ncbi:12013_t:CDS:2 [Dentiscutata erythropus]|uniref:12013_t:CDS:1 n=1 Tax=Dentiscutata erythropus TaxID=1348616 RepID=A0A9N9AS68_9GLOM|nr:12013_t:CDS:2 [Dentiscutata erythropus]
MWELEEENEELQKKLEEEKEKGKARERWFRNKLEEEGKRYDILDSVQLIFLRFRGLKSFILTVVAKLFGSLGPSLCMYRGAE